MQNPIQSILNAQTQLMANSVNNNVDGFLASGVSLTAEGLLLYCQTQLKGIDNEIKSFMAQQKNMQAKKKILSELKTAIETHTTSGKSADKVKQLGQQIGDAYTKAYKELKGAGMDAEAAALLLDYKSWFPNGNISEGKHDVATAALPTGAESEFNAKFKPLADMIDDLGKNAELNMIQLQSLVSSRQTLIQLTTNMMEKNLKGLDGIVGNIR
ncbi:MAG: hypothetical protein IPI67_35125 [Myxococcales bacterium]|nr:hypothetical protein [Myxococcales bacterium]